MNNLITFYVFISQIENGCLSAGDKLPAVRSLSSLLQVNYATVQKAYHQCQLAGIIFSIPGKGSFICDKETAEKIKNIHDLTTMNSPLSEHSDNLLLQLKQQAISSIYDYDFRDIFRYQALSDKIDIRKTGLVWFNKRVPNPTVSRVLPCAGIHEGLLALFILLQKQGMIALPQYFYSGLKSIIQLLDTPCITIPCDQEGPLPEALFELCQRHPIRILYVNPNINNPTTATLSINRRLKLAEVAKRCDLTIIEDDAYGALTTHGIANFCQIAPTRTWYLNGLSKSFAPGLRMAWIYSPSAEENLQLSQILSALKVSDNPLTHQIINSWVVSGAAQRAAMETLKTTRSRVKLFRRIFTQDNYQIDDHGFHVWFCLAEKNAYEVAFLLQQAGISATPSKEFCLDTSPENYLRLSLSTYRSLQLLETALKKFRDVLNNIFLKNTHV